MIDLQDYKGSTFFLPKTYPAVISDEWNWFFSARTVSNKWCDKVDVLPREENITQNKNKGEKRERTNARKERKKEKKS